MYKNMITALALGVAVLERQHLLRQTEILRMLTRLVARYSSFTALMLKPIHGKRASLMFIFCHMVVQFQKILTMAL